MGTITDSRELVERAIVRHPRFARERETKALREASAHLAEARRLLRHGSAEAALYRAIEAIEELVQR